MEEVEGHPLVEKIAEVIAEVERVKEEKGKEEISKSRR